MRSDNNLSDNKIISLCLTNLIRELFFFIVTHSLSNTHLRGNMNFYILRISFHKCIFQYIYVYFSNVPYFLTFMYINYLVIITKINFPPNSPSKHSKDWVSENGWRVNIESVNSGYKVREKSPKTNLICS